MSELCALWRRVFTPMSSSSRAAGNVALSENPGIIDNPKAAIPVFGDLN